MTVMEFWGCTFLAFGPPLAMFSLTIAKDPIRIIILIASAFFWLLSLLVSSLLWIAVVPLKKQLVFGLVFSVLFQELFRYFIYKFLRKAEGGLKKVADSSTLQIVENKHILAYVAGLGFGIISGTFSLLNVLADTLGPATMGLKSGSYLFFITSAATSLCFILLHTFWGIIFFSAVDRRNYFQICYVLASHMLVSCLTLFNQYELYAASLIPAYLVLMCTGLMAYRVVGGTYVNFKASFTLVK